MEMRKVATVQIQKSNQLWAEQKRRRGHKMKKKNWKRFNSMHAYDRNVYRVRIIPTGSRIVRAEAGQTQTGDNSIVFNEPGQLPIVNEPVTLTVFAPQIPDGSWKIMKW